MNPLTKEDATPLSFKKVNTFTLYLHNKVNYDKFHQLMKTVDENFNDVYIESKWGDYKVSPFTFVCIWEDFFNAVINDIEATNYKG